MGVEVVHISAGELESPDAGDPVRLIRLRYREAADLMRTRGKMAALMLNDLDAGAGRVDQGTQYTVNTPLSPKTNSIARYCCLKTRETWSKPRPTTPT